MIKILSKVVSNKYCNALIAIFAFFGLIAMAFAFFKSEPTHFNTFLELGLGYACCFYAAYRSWVKLTMAKYFIGCGLLLYSVMYLLYLYKNFGAAYPHISAVGFSIATLVLLYSEQRASKKNRGND